MEDMGLGSAVHDSRLWKLRFLRTPASYVLRITVAASLAVELVRRLEHEDRGAMTKEAEPMEGDGDTGGEGWSPSRLSGIASEDEEEDGDEGEYVCHSPMGCWSSWLTTTKVGNVRGNDVRKSAGDRTGAVVFGDGGGTSFADVNPMRRTSHMARFEVH